MTAEELLALSDDELDRLPAEEVQTVLAGERARLERIQRRLADLTEQAAEAGRPKTRREVAGLLGITPERVRQIEKIALLKARQAYPTIRHLLES